MTFTVSLKYFDDNQKAIMRKVAFGVTVSTLLDPLAYSICKRLKNHNNPEEGEYIFINEKKGGKLIHQFLLKDDHVCDMTCNDEACECMVAVAIRFDWIKLKAETYPLSKWIPICGDTIEDADSRYRIIIRKRESRYVLRSRFFGKNFEMYPTEAMAFASLLMYNNPKGKMPMDQKMMKVATSGRRDWLNLKPFKNLPISKQVKKDLGFKIDLGDEE